MIKLRTWLFLLLAIVTSTPAAMEHFRDVPVCVKDTRLRAPRPPRVLRVVSARPRLLRVQDDNTSPCPSTGYDAFLKIVTFAAACAWACFFGSLFTDIKRYRRRRRKRRRDTRRARSESGRMPEEGETRGQIH